MGGEPPACGQRQGQEYGCIVLLCYFAISISGFITCTPEVLLLFDLYWDMHLYGLTTCLCLLFLLSALLTGVVCAHVCTTCVHISVPSKVCACVHVCMHACICACIKRALIILCAWQPCPVSDRLRGWTTPS